jgi:hypothetical protein
VSVRANWFLDELVVEVPAVVVVEEVGQPIDLHGDPRLNRRLVELVAEEGHLYDRGVTCAIKDRPDTACSACPVAVVDPDDPHGQLCAVGIEQERVLTTLAVQRARAQES